MSILHIIEIYLALGILVDIILTLVDLEIMMIFFSEGLIINLLIGQVLTIILWPVALLLRLFRRNK